MGRYFVLLSLLGCRQLFGFEEPQITTTLDAASPDAIPDTTVDGPPPVWMVVETMIIDTLSSTPFISQTTLQFGTEYRLRASGTATVVNSIVGDADYFDFANPKDNGCCEDIGLGVNDPVVDFDTQPNWGPYSPTHVYEIPFAATGAPIEVVYQDTLYSNNVGSLTLEILAFQ